MPFARHPFIRMLVLTALGFIAGMELSRPEPQAHATANPLAQLVSPTGTLTLVANTVTNLPLPAGWSGKTCTVILWNNTATPVYFGGPTGSGGASVAGTVSVAGGMPFCTDSASCITGPVSIDASKVALVAAVGVVGIRYAFGGGC